MKNGVLYIIFFQILLTRCTATRTLDEFPEKMENTGNIYLNINKTVNPEISEIKSLRILKLFKKEKKVHAREYRLKFITYHDSFLKNTELHFKGHRPEKYVIIQDIYIGKASFFDKSFETDFVRARQSERRSSSPEEITGTLAVFETKPVSTKYLYKPLKNGVLWQAIHSEIRQNREIIIWKNHRGGLKFFRPYTEFSPEITSTYNSSDYDYENFTLTKVHGNNHNVVTLAFKTAKKEFYYIIQKQGQSYITTEGKLIRKKPLLVSEQFAVFAR